MNQRPVVPQFGNWEAEEDVPYTVYFDKVRKGKGSGKMINPNDPQENPDMFSVLPQVSPHRARNSPQEQMGNRAARPTTHKSRLYNEYGDLRQSPESSPRNEYLGGRSGSGSTHQNRGGQGAAGSGRRVGKSIGSEHNSDRSPLHAQNQSKPVGKGSVSPSLESKNSYNSSRGTPGQYRKKPIIREDESPEGAAVPRFGEWNAGNPSAAANYTNIFNRVREEKNSGAPMVSNRSSNSFYAHRVRQKYKSSCFPCFRS